jgi:predicted ester cyclase
MPDLQDIADRLLAPFNRHDPESVAALYSPDQVTVLPVLPGEDPVRGRGGKIELLKGSFTAFPDLALDLTLVLHRGTHIVSEGVMTGTNTGPMLSHEGELPPTGRRVRLPIVYILDVGEDELIMEDRTYFDNEAFQGQLKLGGHTMTEIDERGAVEAAISNWIAAANANDIDQMAALMAEQFELIPPGEPPVSGANSKAFL